MSLRTYHDPNTVWCIEPQVFNVITYTTSRATRVLTEDAPEWRAFTRELETRANRAAPTLSNWSTELSAVCPRGEGIPKRKLPAIS